jgi:HSP20 family protein
MKPNDLPRFMRPSDFDQAEEDFSAGLENFFSSQRPLFSLSEKVWNPPTDVFEMEETVYVKIEIAGVRDQDLDIAIDKNLLRVRGQRSDQTLSDCKASYHLMEIRYGSFERVFGLPAKLDLDAVTASYRDGSAPTEDGHQRQDAPRGPGIHRWSGRPALRRPR